MATNWKAATNQVQSSIWHRCAKLISPVHAQRGSDGHGPVPKSRNTQTSPNALVQRNQSHTVERKIAKHAKTMMLIMLIPQWHAKRQTREASTLPLSLLAIAFATSSKRISDRRLHNVICKGDPYSKSRPMLSMLFKYYIYIYIYI